MSDTIRGVEIFSVGVHNGDPYTLDDLHEIARNAHGVGFTPAVKLGHSESQALLKAEGLPAAGWIENVRVIGQKLVADFRDVPRKIVDLIKRRAYDRVSSELYINYAANGKVIGKVLKAVALLGADVPAVTDLQALRELFAVEGEDTKIVSVAFAYDTETNGGAKVDDKSVEMQKKLDETAEQTKKFAEEQKARADQLEAELQAAKERERETVRRLAEIEERNFAVERQGVIERAKLAGKITPALEPVVMALFKATKDSTVTVNFSEGAKELKGPALVEELIARLPRLVSFGEKGTVDASDGETISDPQTVVMDRIKKYQSEHPEIDYVTAFNKILDADAKLKAAYIAS